jgi:hypothetical protein
MPLENGDVDKRRLATTLGRALLLSWSAQLIIGQATVRMVQQLTNTATGATQTLAAMTSLCAISQVSMYVGEQQGRMAAVTLLALADGNNYPTGRSLPTLFWVGSLTRTAGGRHCC